ncbi:hypothetical protein [Embleya hyalina]|uniref:Uncharacterized protein n=1 Tax=Embleya hyalina TaxID=516124 RepID=A0A401Z3Y0_9ACTN|nr:hypothetical protein [Embleya hyalina]GCE01554.1 hypothetical protein EHYA_09320 [Embleya hyalina]
MAEYWEPGTLRVSLELTWTTTGRTERFSADAVITEVTEAEDLIRQAAEAAYEGRGGSRPKHRTPDGHYMYTGRVERRLR